MRLVIESDGGSGSCRVLEAGEPTYAELWEERNSLLKANAALIDELSRAKQQVQDNWELVETVACGERLKCSICDNYHPCECDK